MSVRFLPPNYDDGIQSIRRSKDGNPLPSPRVISDVLHEDRDIQLASITHMLMQWGQFVDHDLTGIYIYDSSNRIIISLIFFYIYIGVMNLSCFFEATGQSRGFNGSVPQCCLNSGLGFQPLEVTASLKYL